MMWLGVVLFWAINLVVIMATFLMKKGDAADWYKNVFFYGAYELADLVANKSDELHNVEDGASQPTPCWKPVFIFWWAFSIKYFIPWALFSLMMWNFKADINLQYVYDNDENRITNADGDAITRGYGAYHDLWQLVGFIYPLIGLICFIVPIFVVSTPELALTGKNGKRLEVNLHEEDDQVHRDAEKAYIMGLQAAKNALIDMNKKQESAEVTKN